jgi:hypothetical protein
MTHTHTWEPVSTWYGRYRCQDCAAFGYRKVVLPDGLKATGGSDIVPYRCRVCKAPAIAKDPPGGRSRSWRCAAHRTPALVPRPLPGP